MQSLIFISHRIPYPPDRGEKIRGWNLIQHLAKHYRLFLGCLIDDPADWQHTERLRALCTGFAAFGIDKRWQKLRALARLRPGRPLMLDYYGHPGLHRWTRDIFTREAIDIAYIYSTAMAPYALHTRDAANGGPRRILDMQDIDSEKWTQYARGAGWPMRLIWAREGRTLLAYERFAAMQCERTLFVTEQETLRFGELVPEARDRIDWLEQGVDLERFSPAQVLENPYADASPSIVLTGNMDYWPNADAAIWFAREILPLLRQRAPAPRFVIVGANPTPEVQALAELPDVRVTGRVTDVRPYVAHAAVVVAPLRIARGIQNKVLEGMAMGRPVVASPPAFEGVHAQAGRDLLVADGAQAFTETIMAVLDGKHSSLGAAARLAMESHYAWSAVLARLDGLLA
jgi:sugar transferase (PEP-CTERM/EpsH1 system associated)